MEEFHGDQINGHTPKVWTKVEDGRSSHKRDAKKSSDAGQSKREKDLAESVQGAAKTCDELLRRVSKALQKRVTS